MSASRPARKRQKKTTSSVRPKGARNTKASSNRLAAPSLADLLWEFDRELSQGKTPDWTSYLQCCRSRANQSKLLEDMIRAEAAHAPWNPARIKRRLARYARYDKTQAGCIDLVRGLYADRVAAGEFLGQNDIEPLGISFQRLQLRAGDELVFLGQTLAERYRLEKVLGEGRFGVVYLARELSQGRFVAVKTISGKTKTLRRQAGALLRQEADALTKLQHDGIPKLLDHVQQAGALSIVMDYIDGGTLWDLSRHGPLPPPRAARIVADLADTLDHAHRQGFIHRDLKLANVLVDKQDRPYLADFGLALAEEEQFDRDGQWAGTFGYMPVENLLGMTRQLDGRTDIWSAGVILYELITGEALTARSSREEAFVQAVVLGLRKLKYPRSVLPALRAICEKCLARDPNHRYHTAAHLRRALEEFLSQERSHVQKTSKTRSR